MSRHNDFTIRFWGVRGSIASPGPDTQLVCGNTSCVEVRCGETTLILDAGTGLRGLGDELMKTERRNVHLLLCRLGSLQASDPRADAPAASRPLGAASRDTRP